MTSRITRSIFVAPLRDPSSLAIGIGLVLAMAAAGCQEGGAARATPRIAVPSTVEQAGCNAAQAACDEQTNACLDAIWDGSPPDDADAEQRACVEAALDCTYAIPCNQDCMGACAETLDRCELAGSGSTADDDACYADYEVCVVDECGYDYPAACKACDEAADACIAGLDLDDPTADAVAYQACVDDYFSCWESTCPLP